MIVRTAEGDGTVELFDPAENDTIRAFDPRFGGNSSSVWAATQSGFAIAHVREDGAAISRLDFDTEQMTVVDPSPRPSHYHDLYASPSGRWLVEWNFEHSIPDESSGAIRRYDMVQDRPPLQFGPNLRGFGRATDLVFSNVSDLSGIQMYDPANGESLGKIGTFDGRDVVGVTGISANRLAVRWRDDNTLKLSILTGSPQNR